MRKTYDTAVIGLGAMGSATLFNLADRGRRAIGFEQFDPGHDRGSSHGESRIIRLSYFEDPSYVPLLHKAYEAWRAFERVDSGAPGSLMTITGIVEAGFPGSQPVANSLKAAQLHGLTHTELTGAGVNERFPAFSLPADWQALFQPDGGFLRPERAITRYVASATRRGAAVRANTRVRAIEPRGDAILVHTADETVEVESVVITTGAWIGEFAPHLVPLLQITRQVVGWFPPRTPSLFTPDRCPVFILESEEDHCYGFPNFAGTGVKAASHERGRALAHADQLGSETDADDEAQIARMLRRLMPDVSGPASQLKACMYTRTVDGHFLIDRAPDDDRIIVASPCSGHGFKFASLFGRILADFADGRTPEEDISLFRFKHGAPPDDASVATPRS